jgi:hypothetical protein
MDIETTGESVQSNLTENVKERAILRPFTLTAQESRRTILPESELDISGVIEVESYFNGTKVLRYIEGDKTVIGKTHPYIESNARDARVHDKPTNLDHEELFVEIDPNRVVKADMHSTSGISQQILVKLRLLEKVEDIRSDF